MNKRPSAPARLAAVAALAVALVVAIAVIAGALGGDDDSNGSRSHHHGKQATREAQPKQVPATYEVKSGDTLISISHQTGVPIFEIEELNPEIDPQSLIVGEQLKLR